MVSDKIESCKLKACKNYLVLSLSIGIAQILQENERKQNMYQRAEAKQKSCTEINLF
jgi:hypothetical protein